MAENGTVSAVVKAATTTKTSMPTAVFRKVEKCKYRHLNTTYIYHHSQENVAGRMNAVQ